jgi:D-alanyl-D-alanine carboxypeptidase
MNTGARALDMASTTYADASGLSSGNVSTAEDLYRLARYIENKKSFIFGLTREPDRFIAAQDGSRYSVKNVNAPANTPPFEGGKIGYTDEAKDTMVSIVSIQQGGEKRRVAIIVLGSDDQTQDTSKLARWLSTAASKADQSACASCVLGTYRQIAR